MHSNEIVFTAFLDELEKISQAPPPATTVGGIPVRGGIRGEAPATGLAADMTRNVASFAGKSPRAVKTKAAPVSPAPVAPPTATPKLAPTISASRPIH